MQSAHKLCSDAPELTPEELRQARVSNGVGNILAGRTSLRLAYAQKMAGLPLTIPEETTAEAEAHLHETHYETMWSTAHSKGNLMETQFESPLDTMNDSQGGDSNSHITQGGPTNELYYVSAPDSLGTCLLFHNYLTFTLFVWV